MTYVDKSLCTGCEVCVDACSRGAISMHGYTAVIDETLCTSCGTCLDTCLTGAIVLPQDGSDRLPRGAPASPPEAQPREAGAPELPAVVSGEVLPAPRRQQLLAARPASSMAPATSRLDTAERVLSTLAGIVGLAFDVKRRLVDDRTNLGSGGNRNAAAPREQRGACLPRGSMRPGGSGSGRGRRARTDGGSGRERGPGGGRGRGNRCGVRGPNRAT